MTARVSQHQSPGKKLLAAVRASYVMNGTSLHRWCEENGIKRQYARDVLIGRRNGPRAQELRQRLIAASAQAVA